MGITRNWFTIVIYLLAFFIIGNQTYRIYSDIRDIREVREVKELFEIINSTDNYPTGDEKDIIEKTRNDVILQIKNSNLFDNFGKEYILDSIRNTKIKIFEPSDRRVILKKSTAAMFINIGEFNIENDIILRNLVLESSIKNIILINKNYLKDEELSEILTHEFYHYTDYLFGVDDELSDKLDLSKFIDKNILNKKYLNKKTEIIFNLSGLDDNIKKLANEFSKDALENIDYLSSNNEIFARWKTFKAKLVKLGYVKNSKSIVTRQIIDRYNRENNISLTDLDILLILDWDKIYELDILLN